MAILLAVVFVTMGVSFLCSVMEACLLSLSLVDIGRISDKRPLAAKIWKGFKEGIERPIAVILIINTFAHTIGAAISGAQFERIFGSKWIITFSLVFSLSMIQWTEILPKTLGVRYNKNIAGLIAVPFKYLMYAFTPLVNIVQFFNRPFEGRNKMKAGNSPTEDISVLARFAALDNLINKDQELILSQTVNLSGIKVKDVMVSGEEMKYLSTRMSLADALIEAHIHHHTRFPLVNCDNKDDIVGYVNFKDIVSALQTNPKDPSLKGISRPILEVSEEEPIAAILGKLRKSYQHIAVVRDAKKRVSGLVTLEDVIEAIMGDIEDEYDMLPEYIYQIAVDRYLAGGGVRMDKIKEVTGQALPDVDEPLNKWLIKTLGRIPKVEEVIQCEGCAFIVRKIRRSNIHEVIVQTGET
jgi:CBS domain containing-hemolysin-like protein